MKRKDPAASTNRKKMPFFRVLFWVIFLSAAGYGAWYAKNETLPCKVNRYLKLMQHPNANVASDSWWGLRELYFTKWHAFRQILEHTHDPQPISFLVEKGKVPVPGEEVRWDFLVERGRPIYYKSETIYCRTVGEAILAFVYNERRWKSDYFGDWGAWWEVNKEFYGQPR